MAVFRVNKTKDFTVMSNCHLRDKTLSLKAKGLLSQILSLPDDWNYTVAGLVAINKENESAINSTLKELKERGYLVVNKLMPNETESGRIEYIYNIFEQPTGKQAIEKQGLENQVVVFQGVENQAVENPPQLNTDLSITKEKNTKKQNTEYKRVTAKRFTPPTIDEVRAYCEERQNGIDPEQFVDFYTSKGWKVGKDTMKDWKACIRTWERRGNDSKPRTKTEKKAQELNDFYARAKAWAETEE